MPREVPSAEQALQVARQMVAHCKRQPAAEAEGLLREAFAALEEWGGERAAPCWPAIAAAAAEVQAFSLVDELLQRPQCSLEESEAAKLLESLAAAEHCPRRLLYRAAVHCGHVAQRQRYLTAMAAALAEGGEEGEVCDAFLAAALLRESAVGVETLVACAGRKEYFAALQAHFSASVVWKDGVRSFQGTALSRSGLKAESLPFVVSCLSLAGEHAKAAALVASALLLDRRMRRWAGAAALLRHFLSVHSTAPAEQWQKWGDQEEDWDNEGEEEQEQEAGAEADDDAPADGIRRVTDEQCRQLCEEALAALPSVTF